MGRDELDLDVEIRERVSRWLEESQDVLGRILPEILDDRELQRAGDDLYDPLQRAAAGLRRELVQLRGEVRLLRAQVAELSGASTATCDGLREALGLAERAREMLPSLRAVRLGWIGGIAAGAAGVALLISGIAVQQRPAGPPPPSRQEAQVEPNAPTPTVAVRPKPEPVPPPAVVRPKSEPASPPVAVPHARPTTRPRNPQPTPTNQINNFRAVSLSGHEMQVMVDYAYAGDHGPDEIFLHAAALQTDAWSSRVPGTGFPEAPVRSGSGTVTINITKVPDTGAATSTRVRACMVSIRDRAAFFCETFDYTKGWDS